MVLSVCDSLSDLPEWVRRDEETLSIACDYAIMSVFPIAVALMNEGKRVAIVPLSHLRDFTPPDDDGAEDLALAIIEWAKGPRTRKDTLT